MFLRSRYSHELEFVIEKQATLQTEEVTKKTLGLGNMETFILHKFHVTLIFFACRIELHFCKDTVTVYNFLGYKRVAL